jgi:UDP-N-acetylmuramate: L-alanyl-gamma-D-glutamyl-meso-diaminopimelate ligase
MPKDFFQVTNTTSLHSIPTGQKIHVIGVCGVAMAQLSIALAERGFDVTGSDKEFYEPMKSLLASSLVKTAVGYSAENVPRDAALVVIGNAISYGNPEVDVVENLKLPYTCFPKLLQEVAIAGKHSIVVTGTHGKSTTTAMIASVLLTLKKDPSYFVGGVAKGLPQSLAVGTGGFSVVEGDEYDSAFFAKVPKFSFYTPKTAVVNAIEFDHADIYPNVEAIEIEFDKMVLALPSDGTAICCIDFPRVKALVSQWKSEGVCRILTFGKDPSSDYVISNRKPDGLSQIVTIQTKEGSFEMNLPLVGEYNARNALATVMVGDVVGLPRTEILDALQRFERVKRRQEVRCVKGGVMLIEDFAHHPTAVQQTIEAVREAFPTSKLVAIFEPRSNSSRRKVFQQDYINAFAKADLAILKHVTSRAIDAGVELLDVETLSNEISSSGVSSQCLPDVSAIQKAVWDQVAVSQGDTSNQDVHSVIVVMSNGSFDGLNDLLERELRAK